MGKKKVFENVQKRLKIYKKSDETFENVQKYSKIWCEYLTILEKFSRCPAAAASPLRATNGQVELVGLRLHPTFVASFFSFSCRVER